VAAPTAAVADATTHRLASSTGTARMVTARKCHPKVAMNPSEPMR
jgi:hypothetical protein